MKERLLSSILILTAGFFISSCIEPNDNMQGTFTHSVYFWLKNPDNPEDRAAFEKSITRFINRSKYVKSRYLGTPANTPREVVDNSYTYCLIVSFDSKEDQDKYQSEPVHDQFKEESEHLWERVQIYDSLKVW